MTRPISLSYYTAPELSPLETVAVARRSGCSHVGLRLLGGQPGGSESLLLRDSALQAEMLAAMAEQGIGALDANTARIVPATRIADYIPFLDAAARLGARHVMASVDDTDRSRAADNVCCLCDLAAERGLTVDLEFVPWMALPDLAATAEMIRTCNHDALGIALDTLHFFRSGSSADDLGRLPREWFRYAQICDAPALETPATRDDLIFEATRERLLPGAGDIDLGAILRALPAGIPLALEIPQSALAARVDADGRASRAVAATRKLLTEAGVG